MTTGKTIALTRWTFVGKVMSLLFNMLSATAAAAAKSLQLCPTLCDPMNHSTPGLPVHHQLPEFTQIHVHRVRDAIQPSHPLSSPSPPAPIPPSIRVFSNESTLRMRWPKYWSFSFSISPSNAHPGLISFRMDWLDLLAVQGTLSHVQFFATLWTVVCQAPLSMGFSRKEYWSGLPCPPPGDPPSPGIELTSL